MRHHSVLACSLLHPLEIITAFLPSYIRVQAAVLDAFAANDRFVNAINLCQYGQMRLLQLMPGLSVPTDGVSVVV